MKGKAMTKGKQKERKDKEKEKKRKEKGEGNNKNVRRTRIDFVVGGPQLLALPLISY